MGPSVPGSAGRRGQRKIDAIEGGDEFIRAPKKGEGIEDAGFLSGAPHEGFVLNGVMVIHTTPILRGYVNKPPR